MLIDIPKIAAQIAPLIAEQVAQYVEPITGELAEVKGLLVDIRTLLAAQAAAAGLAAERAGDEEAAAAVMSLLETVRP